jgi:hypothetical protein
MSQGMLHPPQLSTLVDVSVHESLQTLIVLGQPQFPLKHGVPEEHGTSQLPQLFGSVERSVHVPSHMTSFGAHGLHVPPTHPWPAGHGMLHPPQS